MPASSVNFLGARLSLAPVLGNGALRLANNVYALQKVKQKKGMSEGVFQVTPEMERGAAPVVPDEPESKPASGSPAKAPAKPANKPAQPAMSYQVGDPARGGSRPVAVPRTQVGSNVYTRAMGSERPGKAAYSHRDLTPDEKGAITAWLARHHTKTGLHYVNPMAVALDIDAPVHKIAHYIETEHNFPTTPGRHGGVSPLVTPESSAAESDAPGATESHNYDSWLADYERRLLAEHDPEGEGRRAAEAADETRQKEAEVGKLADYAKAGVISPSSAVQGAQVSSRLRGWTP